VTLKTSRKHPIEEVAMKEENKKQVTALRHHLTDLEQRLNKVKAKGVSGFARQLAFQSQVGYYENVKKEIDVLELEDDLAVSVRATVIQNHLIPPGLLSSLLVKLQQITKFVIKGVRSRSLEDDSLGTIGLHQQLLVAGWAPSSFTVKFRFSDQETIDRGLSEIINNLFMLFREDVPDDDLTKTLMEFNLRPRYEDFLAFVADNRLELEIKSPYSERQSVQFTEELAENRRRWIDKSKTWEGTLNINGRLRGGDIKKGTFIIESDKGIPYKGNISEDALEQIQSIPLGAYIAAQIKEITEKKRAAIKEKSRFILEDIVKHVAEVID
jgi:hypothetical protein